MMARWTSRRARGLALALARVLGSVLALALAFVLALAPPPAHALQPLEDFVRAARAFNPDQREAVAAALQRADEADQARDKLLPTFTARGAYTWNQVPVEPAFGPKKLIIQPEHQLDATFSLDVPLFDLTTWRRKDAAALLAAASNAVRDGTRLQVEKAVARGYFQVVGAEAVADVATRSLAVARETLAVAHTKVVAKSAPEVDERRAEALVARAESNVAEAELARDLARRRLETLTGVAPAPGAPVLADDLHAEDPLATWLADAGRHPAVQAAEHRTAAAAETARAAHLQLVPTLAANATERLTNATGFEDKSSYFTAGLTLTWRFDLSALDGAGAADAGVMQAAAASDRARAQVADDIVEAWRRIDAAIAKVKAARAETTAATAAAGMTQLRYEQGAGTALDLTIARRDQFAAEVGRAQAEADLAFARAYLRLAAARDAH